MALKQRRQFADVCFSLTGGSSCLSNLFFWPVLLNERFNRVAFFQVFLLSVQPFYHLQQHRLIINYKESEFFSLVISFYLETNSLISGRLAIFKQTIGSEMLSSYQGLFQAITAAEKSPNHPAIVFSQ